MSRNRKRTNRRRPRPAQGASARPGVATAHPEREDGAPGPLEHGTPDVELAEAQLALGRPELIEHKDREPVAARAQELAEENGPEDSEQELPEDGQPELAEEPEREFARGGDARLVDEPEAQVDGEPSLEADELESDEEDGQLESDEEDGQLESDDGYLASEDEEHDEEFEPDEDEDEDEFEPEEDVLETEALAGGRRRGLRRGRDRPAHAVDGASAATGGAVPAVRQKSGIRLVNFLEGSWRELQRVQWPDRRQVMQATGVVLGFVLVAAAFLGVADEAATQIVNFILK